MQTQSYLRPELGECIFCQDRLPKTTIKCFAAVQRASVLEGSLEPSVCASRATEALWNRQACAGGRIGWGEDSEGLNGMEEGEMGRRGQI